MSGCEDALQRDLWTRWCTDAYIYRAIYGYKHILMKVRPPTTFEPTRPLIKLTSPVAIITVVLLINKIIALLRMRNKEGRFVFSLDVAALARLLYNLTSGMKIRGLLSSAYLTFLPLQGISVSLYLPGAGRIHQD